MFALNVILEITLFVVIGIFIMKIGLVNANFRTQLSKFVMNVALPCLIADSLRSQTFDGSFDELLQALGLCILTLAVLFIVGQVSYLIMGKSDLGKTTRFSTLFGNFTFIGFAVVEGLCGSEGLFMYTLFTLPVRLVFYTSPAFLLTPNGEKREKKSAKEILKSCVSAPTVAVAVGLVLYFTGLQLPEFVDGAITSLRAMASPLGMLICGMSLASTTPKVLWQRKKVFLVALVRNFIAPAAVMAVLALLPLDESVKMPILVYAIVPVPSLLTTFSISLGRSDDACADASAAVFGSTILSIVTIPMWIAIANMIL